MASFPIRALGLLLPACLSYALPARAAQLEVVSGTRAFTTAAFGTTGQSFTAIGSSVTSIGFQFALFNPGTAAADYTLSIRRGAGLDGALLYNRSFSVGSAITSRTLAWVDIALGSGVATDAGAVYSAVISGGNARYGIGMGPTVNIYTGVPLTGDAYAGGKALFTTVPYRNCATGGDCDLNFRLTAAAVPEPATWAMLGMGLALTGATMRRRARGRVIRNFA
jgi:hypothetical protein